MTDDAAHLEERLATAEGVAAFFQTARSGGSAGAAWISTTTATTSREDAYRQIEGVFGRISTRLGLTLDLEAGDTTARIRIRREGS